MKAPSLMTAPLLLMLSAATAWAADPAGHYVLHGVHEVGSELLLKPDGTFEYMLAYGAADFLAEGAWRLEDGSVVLNTRGKKEPPFRFLRSAPSKEPGIRVWVKARNGNPAEHIEVALKTDAGFTSENTGADGAAHFTPEKPPRGVAFRIDVYNLTAGPFELNPAHQDFYFEVNGDEITRVHFENERLVIDGKDLLMRYWTRDEPMRYARQ
jgi:hypothetical protein